MRKEEAATTTPHGYNNSGEDADEYNDDSGEEYGEEADGKDLDRWGTSNSRASAVIPVPTAIFYVNHQIRQEATEVFYGFNRFTFDNDARTALKFLKAPAPALDDASKTSVSPACQLAPTTMTAKNSGTPFPLSSLATCLYTL